VGTSREAASGAGVRRGADVVGAGPTRLDLRSSPPSPEGLASLFSPFETIGLFDLFAEQGGGFGKLRSRFSLLGPR